MKTYIEQLFENCGMNTPVEYLCETASSKAQQYKVNSPEEFEMLVSQDPTYDPSVDDGKFINWIFSLWRNFKTDEQKEKKYQKAVAYKQEHPDAQLPPKPEKLSQDKIEDFEKIRDFLLVLKDNLKLIKGDMSQFKSVADLASFVRGIQEKDVSVDKRAMKNYKILREAMNDGLEIVYNGPNFIIGVPTTYEASSHFKDPITNWCTAYPNMYDRYLQGYGGKYYIHLNKHTGDLYQLHYESDQFKDASDQEIDKVKFISTYPELKDFYDKILPMDNYKWWFLHNRKPTEEELLEAVKQNDEAILYMFEKGINPSEKIQIEAIQQYRWLIKDILKNVKQPTEEVQLEAVKQAGDAIQYIQNPSEKIKLAAVKEFGRAIRFIKNPSEEVQLAAVKQDGRSIQFIIEKGIDPSEKVQLAAVKEDGDAIRYIKNPTEEMKQIAIKKDGYAIQYIKNPSEEMKLKAVKQNGNAIMYIQNPSEEVQLAAVKQTGEAIEIIKEIIKNPSEKVQMAAIKSYMNEYGFRPEFIYKVSKNPSEKIIDYAFSFDPAS